MNPLNVLSAGNFSVTNILSRSESWEQGFVVDNSENGRQHHLIHIITEGRRIYTANGHKFTVDKGTVLLIPHATRYITLTETATSGIGVCFDLSGDIALAQGVYCDWYDLRGDYLHLFEGLDASARYPIQDALRCQSLLLRILDRMNREAVQSSSVRKLIEPALPFIEAHCFENLPVRAYADACSLSESYFRSKFTECIGMSPIQYRDDIRFQAARKMFAQGMSVSDIAEAVGFCDVSYFRKMYKKRMGIPINQDLSMEMI